MKKSDLKTGMIVKYRNGEKRWVLLDTKFGDIIVDIKGTSHNKLSYYTDDLVNYLPEYTIVKVYDVGHENKLMNKNVRGDVIWEREPIKEMTLDEVCGELGYDIKIIKGGGIKYEVSFNRKHKRINSNNGNTQIGEDIRGSFRRKE